MRELWRRLSIKVLSADKSKIAGSGAARALGEMGNEKAVAPLVKVLLKTDKSDDVRSSAAAALGIIGGKKSEIPLIKVLTTDKSVDVRWSAAEALGNVGSEKAIGSLKLALKDEGKRFGKKVKDIAFLALEKITRRTQKRILGDVLQNINSVSFHHILIVLTNRFPPATKP